MKPKEILYQWIDAFNNADTETIAKIKNRAGMETSHYDIYVSCH